MSDSLREALDDLQQAEFEYFQMHDRHGGDSKAAGRSRDRLRWAGDKARAALSAPQADAEAWPNGCDKTVPAALRYLADHDRPSGGQSLYNSEHLHQLASEIERAVATPTSQSQADAAAWQCRTKHPQEKTWSEWEECEKLTAEFIAKTGSWDDHDAQSRALYTAPPSQSAQMRKALEECISVLELVEQPAIRDTDHTEEVHALGERMGYGALMSAASAEWRASLEDDGLPTGGELVAGPCYATVLATLKKAREALSRADEGKESEGGHESRVAAVSCEIPTQRSGESRDPLGDGSVNTSPHREDAAGVAPGPSDPKPADPDAEAEAAIRLEAAQQYLGAIDKLNRATDSEINGPSDPTPPDQREEIARIIKCCCCVRVQGEYHAPTDGIHEAADRIIALLRGGQ